MLQWVPSVMGVPSGLVLCFESRHWGSTPQHPMLLISLSWFIHILLVLLTVAFFTLFERKVIGLVHLRLGPNKVSFLGILQPLLDAFKLLSKQSLTSIRANKVAYTSSPQLSLFISLLFWILLPFYSFTFSNSYSLLVFSLLGSCIVFTNLLAGWSSNSKYTLIGALRSVAQSVSYEAVLTTLVILFLVLSLTYNINSITSSLSFFVLLFLPLWIFCTLAETHRAPFDFSESESELVSGYNTEYSGALFAFVFLGEYSSLLFSCGLIYFLFFSLPLITFNPLLISFFVILISILFILIRVTYCRYRYDYLISLAWKSLLPVTLSLLIITYIMVVII